MIFCLVEDLWPFFQGSNRFCWFLKIFKIMIAIHWLVFSSHSLAIFCKLSSLSKLDAPIPLIDRERHASVIKTNSQFRLLRILIGGIRAAISSNFNSKLIFSAFWRNSKANFPFCFWAGLLFSYFLTINSIEKWSNREKRPRNELIEGKWVCKKLFNRFN